LFCAVSRHLFLLLLGCALFVSQGIPFWNTPEYAERVKAENAALEAERAAAIAGEAPGPAEEEPEPFWSGLVTGAAEVKNALAPPVFTLCYYNIIILFFNETQVYGNG